MNVILKGMFYFVIIGLPLSLVAFLVLGVIWLAQQVF